MRVLITGATGLIGQEIIKLCQKESISVNFLTTNKSKLKTSEHLKGFYWNPISLEINKDCFNGVDAIIHLAGATVAKRWTSKYKKEILDSRKLSTYLLFKTLGEIPNNVSQIISASAIGIYPSSLTKYYDEDNQEVSTSFLGNVVNKWEQEVDLLSNLGITVSKIRIGLVLSNRGGALLELVKPIKFGLGAAMGNGNQWQSWIHITDLANLFLFVLKNKAEGVYNGVSPNPVTNQELIKSTALALGKPLILPNIPKLFMQIILGDMHHILFDSQRVSSKKIEDLGFEFQFHHLQPALENLLIDL